MNKENSFRAVASREIVLPKRYVFLSVMIQAFQVMKPNELSCLLQQLMVIRASWVLLLLEITRCTIAAALTVDENRQSGIFRSSYIWQSIIHRNKVKQITFDSGRGLKCECRKHTGLGRRRPESMLHRPHCVSRQSKLLWELLGHSVALGWTRVGQRGFAACAVNSEENAKTSASSWVLFELLSEFVNNTKIQQLITWFGSSLAASFQYLVTYWIPLSYFRVSLKYIVSAVLL